MNAAVRFNLFVAAFNAVVAVAIPPVSPGYLWFSLISFGMAMICWERD